MLLSSICGTSWKWIQPIRVRLSRSDFSWLDAITQSIDALPTRFQPAYKLPCRSHCHAGNRSQDGLGDGLLRILGHDHAVVRQHLMRETSPTAPASHRPVWCPFANL